METVEIDDRDEVYRRLAVSGHFYSDGSVNSNAYKLNGKPDPEISVDLARLSTPQESLSRAQQAGFRLGVLRVAELRALGLTVRHDPTPENPAHCVIEGNSSKAICRELAQKTVVV